LKTIPVSPPMLASVTTAIIESQALCLLKVTKKRTKDSLTSLIASRALKTTTIAMASQALALLIQERILLQERRVARQERVSAQMGGPLTSGTNLIATRHSTTSL
jgi:hypothetical protein